MESNVYQKQQKKSRSIVALRLVVAAVFLLAGVVTAAVYAGWIGGTRISLADDMPISGLPEGTLVEVKSCQFVYSGVYIYDKDENKPTAYVYFVPVYDGEGRLIEVYVIESKKDYIDDGDMEDPPLRTFWGHVARDADWSMNAEQLKKIGDNFSDARVRELLPLYYIAPGNGSNSIAGWMGGLLALGGLILGVNLAAWFATAKLRKRMDAYGVDEVAVSRFEREYERGYETYGKIDLTESWLFNRTIGATCLLPLKEVVWLYEKQTRHYTNGIPSGTTYTVELFFSDGGTLSVASKKKVVEGMLGAFAARCPQALLGHSDERAKAWAKDKDQIIQASREKAAALWQAQQSSQAEEEDAPQAPEALEEAAEEDTQREAEE